jgi:spore maturation protein CgeB
LAKAEQTEITSSTSARKIRILLVAPGSLYSTYDTYRYYFDALKRNERVQELRGFSFHHVVEYHALAREAMLEHHGIYFGSEVEDIVRAARELILELILDKPDVIMFIDGTKFPEEALKEMRRILKYTGQPTLLACYMTEAPYINDILLRYQRLFDVVFLNDKKEVENRNPDGRRYIDYLPHSFNPLVHYPFEVDDIYKRDVFFCGTIFPERANILGDVNWTGIDAYIAGATSLATDEDVEKLSKFGILDQGTLPNQTVAEYYRGSKISINLNRVYGWTPKHEVQNIENDRAYSVGPRVIEAAACGAFILSEPRPELEEIFGDSIPTFTNGKQLEELIRYYLTHEEERQAKAIRSTEIVQTMTYDERSKQVVDTLISALDFFRGTK